MDKTEDRLDNPVHPSLAVKQTVMTALSQVLQNNLGNRITTELANGILFFVNQNLPDKKPDQENG
jgi:hypothetical protein